ncbi:DUF5681 domain-containing protein [Enterovirga rhinocerotis]|uniref:DUF5681 domain-containing protein n=1 Tax=Enterovirga rhinocerotis TaxID=1339210 RepID=A0A4R7C5A2_9HYPH|nr:DUF5681 domain-containing protein [Enterovirga rhinocerotis]TDR93062.1 hypothetical protein EV668_0312 [Enterovirga rhinocerotis]
MAENAGRKQAGGRFQRGQSGNPAGKKPGTRHATTILAEKIMSEDVEGVVKAVVEAAKDGDMTAARIIMDRIAPVRRGAITAVTLPTIESPADLTKATSAILAAVSEGELTPVEAAELGKLVEAHGKAIEITDLHERLSRLEACR